MDIHKSKRPSLGSSKETSIDQKVSACTATPRTPCINIPTHCFSMTGARMVVFPTTSLCGVLVFDSVSGRRLCLLRLLRLLHFVNHQLCHTQLCQPPSLSHTTLSTTIFHTQLSPSLSHTIFVALSFHLAGVARVALMALGWLWWRAWTGLVAGDAAALCVAGVALGHIHLRFTWQAWHLETSTFVLRGRRDTYGIGLALVARLDWISRR